VGIVNETVQDGVGIGRIADYFVPSVYWKLQRLDRLTIYRGIGHVKGRNGLSWTLDREKAIWFARRFVGVRSGRSSLLTARAYKSDVHALLLGRKEQEVVIDKFQITAIEKTTA
jgi:hypothetical protein